MLEKWKDISGFEGLYKVSNYGNIKSVHLNWKNMKHGRNPKGYHIVILSKNGIRHSYKIHRLVAQAFIPNPNHLPQVNHVNGNKDDNHWYNLEWCSCKDNIKHAWENGLCENVREVARKMASLRKNNYIEL